MIQVTVLRVALDMPLRRLFDYLPPPPQRARSEIADSGEAAHATQAIQPGMRVRVPFGRQRLVGMVVSWRESSDVPADRLKPVLEVLDSRPVLDQSALALLTWAADYYHHPIGEVLAGALPKALRIGAPAVGRQELWSLTTAGSEAHSQGEPRRAPLQRALLGLLARGNGVPTDELAGVPADELAAQLPNWRSAARQLLERGWVQSEERELATTGVSSVAAVSGEASEPELTRASGPELGEEQRAAVESVAAALGRFSAFVLHGVTGSGKTEVYLRLTERVLAQGRRCLVLVPEIGLTPQLIQRFRQRFDVPLAVLHSALTDHERLLAWRDAFSGRARIILGTRSAVFAPASDLGLIVVDEEHDASFKQHEGGFRYSARDLAVMRAQQADVPILLGSATPALETLQNVATGRYARLSLPRRPEQAPPPRIALIDLRAHAVHSGISTPAVQAMEKHLQEDGQVLVFLNRRGYAPTLLCTACGWTAPCSDCDARLTVHLAAGRLKCHHCGADGPLPTRCPQCGFLTKSVGQGTERIEEALAAQFPDVARVRLDRDVVRKRGDLEEAVRRMASGEARILIGTQMVTKGHDFPNVTLVVVLNADQGLFSTDFRAPERLAQTIVQVAGRAGRGARRGEVLIQTEFPDHPMLRSLLSEGYDGFARTALAERAQASWPPFSRLAAVRDSAPNATAALTFLDEARQLAEPTRSVKVLGPVPAAMARRAGRHHAQLLVESADRTALHRFLDRWLPQVEELPSARRVRWALDVDPIELF